VSSVDIETLLELRQHLSIIHHVPGRMRLRLGPALYAQASALNGNGLRSFLESLEGIHDIRVNPAAASLIIQYNTAHFPPTLWETLVAGNDEEAARLISDLIDNQVHPGHQN
jgi:hypothetical protein